MEQAHRQLLRRNRIALVENLRLEPVLPALQQARLLADAQVEALMAEPILHERIARFLDVLKRCGPQAFPTFLDALRVSQPYLAQLLERKGEKKDPSALHVNGFSSKESSRLSAHPSSRTEQPWPKECVSPLASPTRIDLNHLPGVRLLSISSLSKGCREKLCTLLDRLHPFGDDWRRLYELLSLPLDRRSLIESSEKSPTDETLFVWRARLGDRKATVGTLLDALAAMQRQDAVDVVYESLINSR